MRKLTISTAPRRTAKQWRREEVTWEDLCGRLSATRVTGETAAEYAAMSRDEQGAVKDVGGFVGGALRDGLRRAANVETRSMLTLDVDHAGSLPIFWEGFGLVYDCAACLYTTHKHAEASPRFRLIIPLLRDVDPAEYEAVARMVASDLGIEQFDDTTYQPSRLMYYPSTSRDAPFVFERQEGEALDPDAVLGRYADPSDVSEWPHSERDRSERRAEVAKAGDPLRKSGVVGAFCRAYTIGEAIASFLPEVYSPCDFDGGRYTYAQGSSSGGLVVYNDLYAYSHHESDPAGGRLCNAYDLVRLHRFGHMDEGAAEGTPVNKLPSYATMNDLATGDPRCKAQLFGDSAAAAAAEFGIESEAAQIAREVEAAGLEGLQYDRNGRMKGLIGNYMIILEHDPNLKGGFLLDEFRHTMEVTRAMPWRSAGDRSEWTDSDDAGLRAYIERGYATVDRGSLADALVNVYQAHRTHPVREYLRGLSWDGIERLDRLLVEYLGADDTPYVRGVTRKAFTAAVARVMQPGRKFDHVLTLVGREGIGKSTLLAKMGRKWFSDNFVSLQDKAAVEQVQGVWIMEISELAGLKKAEVESIKSYVSRTEDRIRMAYAKRVEAFPRQCVFFGTTNTHDFLRGADGNRRFWPVDVEGGGRLDVWRDLTAGEVDQLWAEAVHRYDAGEPLHLDGGAEAEARAVQEAHSETDARAGVVYGFLSKRLPLDWDKRGLQERRIWLADPLSTGIALRKRVSRMEIWVEALGGDPRYFGRREALEIADIMKRAAGWKASPNPVDTPIYGRQKCYYRDGLDLGAI